MAAEEAESGRKRGGRRLGSRGDYYDAVLDTKRKVQIASFVCIAREIMGVIEPHKVYRGSGLAESCCNGYSEGTVWAHLHWLADRGILTRKFDGRRTWFGWNPKMSEEAEGCYRIIRHACFS